MFASASAFASVCLHLHLPVRLLARSFWAGRKRTQPVVDPEVRLRVNKQHGARSHDSRELVQRKRRHGEANVGQEDEGSLAGAEDGAVGAKVALAEHGGGGLLQTVAAGGDVEEQVDLPREQLVEHERDELVGGGVLEHLEGGQGALGVVGLGPGDKGHVLLHVAGVLVVAVVRELPRVVRHQQGGVGEEADDVVQQRVLGKGAVSGLVAQDPEASADKALDEAVDDPGNGPESGIRNGGNVGKGSPAKSSNHDHIAHQIAHGDGHGRLKAVLGDGGPNRVDIGKPTVLLRQLAVSGVSKTEPTVEKFSRGERKVFIGLSRTTDIEATAPPPLLVTVVVVAIVKWAKASNSMG